MEITGRCVLLNGGCERDEENGEERAAALREGGKIRNYQLIFFSERNNRPGIRINCLRGILRH